METIRTRYYHITGCPTETEATWQTTDNYIKADVYYTKGGYSYFTYKNTPRGYFMSVSRMGRYSMNDGTVMEAVTLFGSGAKKMIKEVSRQTKKASAEALEVYEKDIDDFVKEVFSDLEIEFVEER